MSDWRAAVLDVCASGGVTFADDGWGAAELAPIDMHGQLILVTADEDLDATATERRSALDIELRVYLDTPAGSLETAGRAIAVAAAISEGLLRRHSLPIAPLDREGPHDPFTVELAVQLVGELAAGNLAAEEALGEQLRRLAHRLATADPPDALVEATPLSADVVVSADTYAAEVSLDLTVDLHAGSWGGVRNWLAQVLADEGWRLEDDGWGAAALAFGDRVAAVVVRAAAGARFEPAVDDADGLILSLRALLTTADPEDGA